MGKKSSLLIDSPEEAYALMKAAQLRHLAEAREEDTRVSVAPRLVQPRHGYVYLVQQVGGIYFKLGRSKTPVQRIGNLNVKLPFEIEVLALVETDDMVALERELHEKYAARHVRGEWYALTPEDVAEIKTRAQ